MLEVELLPAEERSSRRLIVVLHGLGDSTEGYTWMPSVLGLPWLNYLLVNAPDDYYTGYSWYDFDGDAETGVRRSRKLLVELLDEQQRRGFPSEQTVLFGFSQGGLMTVDVGYRYPRRLAGLVAISGYVHEPEELLAERSPVAEQLPLLATHGTLDPLIPMGLPKSQYQFLRSRGLPVEWHEFVKVHTIDDREEIPLIRRFLVSRLQPGAVPGSQEPAVPQS